MNRTLDLVVERSAGVEHHGQLTARLEHPVDLGGGASDVRGVVQDAVAEDDVEAVIRPGDVEHAALAHLILEAAHGQPLAHPFD